MTILVLAEHDNKSAKPATLNAVADKCLEAARIIKALEDRGEDMTDVKRVIGWAFHVLRRMATGSVSPVAFQRFVVGLSYTYNEYLRFALDSQNLLFYHSQFSLPTSSLAKFGYVPGSKLNGQFVPKTGSIPNLVPLDTHAIFLNMEFAY